MADAYTIDRIVQLIRENADEPAVRAKYTPAQLLMRIESAFQEIIAELNCNADNPVLVRHNLSIGGAGEDQVYLLPPSVEQIRRIAKIDTVSRRPVWWIEPKALRAVGGPNITLEGRLLRLDPKWQGGTETVEVLYVPNGDFRMHYGAAAAIDAGSVTLAASPTLGTLDTRENCYAGAVVRIVASDQGYIQERQITAYDRETRIATVEPDFSPLPTSNGVAITYEIVPSYLYFIERIAALHVSRDVLSFQGNAKKVGLVLDLYNRSLRTARMQLSRMQNIIGEHFNHETGRDASSIAMNRPIGVV